MDPPTPTARPPTHAHVIARFPLPPKISAARALGISLNKLKRACRQYGIPRWPYRQVRSIRSTIQSLEKALEKCDSELEAANLKERLESLVKKESLVCKFASCGEQSAPARVRAFLSLIALLLDSIRFGFTDILSHLLTRMMRLLFRNVSRIRLHIAPHVPPF